MLEELEQKMIHTLLNNKEKVTVWLRKHEAILLTIMFSLFAFLLYGSLSFHQNLWYDEAYQLVLNRYSFQEIIYFVSKDFSPPLYALGLKLITNLFGDSLLVGRMFSLSFVIGMFFIAFYPIRRMFGNKTAIFFSSFLLFSSSCFFASIEVRTYSLAMFSTLGATVYAIQLLKEEKIRYWVLYTLFGIASLYSHNYAILCIFILNIMVFIYSLIKNRTLAWKFLLCQTLMFFAFLPWLGILFGQAKELSTSFWIEKPNIETFKSLLTFIFVLDKRIVYSLLLILGIGIGYTIWKDKHRIYDAILILLPCFLSVGFFILWSFYKTPMFIPKYIVPTVGLIFLSISIIYGTYKNNWIGIVIVVLMCIGSYQMYQQEYPKIDDSSIIEMERFFEKEHDSYFIHSDESTIGLIEYYIKGTNHIVLDNMTWVVRVPELFGNVVELDEKEKIQDITKEIWAVNCNYEEREKLRKEGFVTVSKKEISNPYFGVLFFEKMELKS